MPIIALVGFFFLVLAGVFAWSAFSTKPPGSQPAAKARQRVALIFAIVGIALLVRSAFL